MRIALLVLTMLLQNCARSNESSSVKYINDNGSDASRNGVDFSVSSMINETRKYVEIYAENYSDRDIRCDYIRVLERYDSESGSFGFRSASVQNVLISKGTKLSAHPESDKEIIQILDAIENTSRIATLSPNVEMRCFDGESRLIAGDPNRLNLDFGVYINESRKFVEFSIRNHESKPVVCKFLKVRANYVNSGSNLSFGYRTASLRQIEIAPGELLYSPESMQNKDIINTWEMVSSGEAVVDDVASDLKFDCQLKSE